MSVEAVIATQVIDTTTVGRSLMTAADAAAARTALSLGTLATQSGTFSGTSSGTNTGDQNLFSTIAVSGQSNVVADQASDTLTIVAGTNITITTDAGTDTITISASGGGLSGTGSVDNAVLRADGTGGATLQNSAFVIADNATASPNNTVNHASIQATGATTNVSVSIVPKGTGAFCLSVPDATSTGGNARGSNAVDLQTLRSAATEVASGTQSFVAGTLSTASATNAVSIGRQSNVSGVNSVGVGSVLTVSGSPAVVIGSNSTANNTNTVAIGEANQSTAYGAVTIGNNSTASGNTSIAIGACSASGGRALATGFNSTADRYGQRSHTGGVFAVAGDCQRVDFGLSIKTTNATPTTMMLDGSSTRLTIPSGKMLFADVLVCGIKSDGSAAACYKRKVAIKNVGGTTALVGSVETIGTDIEDNASTDVAITADNTNDALQINVTGITSETWRWVAVVEGLEIAYGT